MGFEETLASIIASYDDGEENRPEPATECRCGRCNDVVVENAGDLCEDCSRCMERGYDIAVMTGRNRTTTDGSGSLWHAVPADAESSPFNSWVPALCGRAPGKRGNGWSGYRPADREVTCERCLKKIGAQLC